MSGGLWCDGFDADLLKVVPGAAEALGGTAGAALETYSHPTNGKINCPSAWWEDGGLLAYFWTDPAFGPPPGYSTDAPVVACTFLEAVRDEWVHGSVVAVNRRFVWEPPEAAMMRLMHDLRGRDVLPDAVRADLRWGVLRSLEAAAGRLRAVVAL